MWEEMDNITFIIYIHLDVFENWLLTKTIVQENMMLE